MQIEPRKMMLIKLKMGKYEIRGFFDMHEMYESGQRSFTQKLKLILLDHLIE